jgi:hypothetical protein
MSAPSRSVDEQPGDYFASHYRAEIDVLRRTRATGGSGARFDELRGSTPLGDVVMALVTDALHDDVEQAPFAWGLLSTGALHTFAEELHTIVAEKAIEDTLTGPWSVVRRIAIRMKASAIVAERLHEARYGTSPHWGGPVPPETRRAEAKPVTPLPNLGEAPNA